MEDRVILHSDLNSFYTSVEMMLDPSLRGKAVAVCGSTEDRHGIVLAKSDLAQKAGIKTGMVNWEARQLCKDLIIVPPHYDQYLKYSKMTQAIYQRYTDLMEPFGMDECWLDVTGSKLYGSGMEIAEQIRQACREELGLTVSIGVSYNKIFAKLGSEKLKEGKDLIRYFCTPAKAKDGSAFRHYPSDAPEKWETFKAYNLRDVETEMAIQDKLSKFPVAESEWHNYHLDQQINDRGIMLDMTMVHQAIACDDQFKHTHMEQARSVTGLENPNSPAQLKEWLAERGVEAESLSKAAVLQMLEEADGEVELALSLRQELAKSSVKKYTAMESVVGSDSRARGLIQFYGANRTGRYAGRLIQVQNLPQNHLPDLNTVRTLIRSGQFDTVELLYDSVPMVLSELIRTAFVPKPSHRFFVADFSAIEARVIAWIAGEQWRQEVFAAGGDIYCASASQMFHVPVEKHGVNGHLRQKGKIAELALGYGGSVGALKAMGALNMGVPEEELKPLVDAWRLANPNIVRLWWGIDRAASTCVREKTTTECRGIRFIYQSGMMFIVLPSGRKLAYVKPRMGVNRYGNESVTFEGVGEQKKWLRLESYGPKFVENIVQATARDILAEAMLRLDAHGYKIVMHVHDEAVIEAPADTSLEDICEVMGQTPTWAKGLLLRADGYICDFYKKD